MRPPTHSYTLVYKFARHLVAKGIFHALIALYPALVIIFHGALIRRCMVFIALILLRTQQYSAMSSIFPGISFYYGIISAQVDRWQKSQCIQGLSCGSGHFFCTLSEPRDSALNGSCNRRYSFFQVSQHTKPKKVVWKQIGKGRQRTMCARNTGIPRFSRSSWAENIVNVWLPHTNMEKLRSAIILVWNLAKAGLHPFCVLIWTFWTEYFTRLQSLHWLYNSFFSLVCCESTH